MEDLHDSDFNDWFRRARPDKMDQVKEKIASFLGMKAENFAFVENATRGKKNNAALCF